MRRRYVPFLFLICQILITNESVGLVKADSIECVTPVYPVFIRLGHVDQPPMSEEKRREIFTRLRSYFQRSNSPLPASNAPVYTSEGGGEVFVSGDDLCTGGVTDVEGSVPISGSVSFGGPVRAAGTVIITGRCGPARFSPLSIPSPLPPSQPNPSPILPAPVETSTIEHPPPAFLPNISLPPIIIPAIVVPAYVVPEVVLPSDMDEIGCGYGKIVFPDDDCIVCGTNHIDTNDW